MLYIPLTISQQSYIILSKRTFRLKKYWRFMKLLLTQNIRGTFDETENTY
jgi:hypothetical protein